MVKERLKVQICTLPFQSVHLSVSRNGLVIGEYTTCLKNYVEKEALSVIDRSCGTRFSVYLLVTSFDRALEYQVVLCPLAAMTRTYLFSGWQNYWYSIS